MSDKIEAANDDGLDIFAEFAVTDDGVWVPFKGDVEFLIARYNNPKFKRRLGYFYEKHRRVLEGKGDAAEQKSNEVMAQVLAETILLGWKGKVRFQGQMMEYSVANAAKMLAVQTFREWVIQQAQDSQAYKAVQDDKDAENL